MSVKNINGVKEISASEDGKTVKIKDDPAQGIKIELTEKQNGKEVTKKYDAKNVEELKKKQPAGYELYKKYGDEQPGNGLAASRPAGRGRADAGQCHPCHAHAARHSACGRHCPCSLASRCFPVRRCPPPRCRWATTRRLRSRLGW